MYKDKSMCYHCDPKSDMHPSLCFDFAQSQFEAELFRDALHHCYNTRYEYSTCPDAPRKSIRYVSRIFNNRGEIRS